MSNRPRAGLHPREAPRTGATPGEAAVHDALRTALPESWLAWHSLAVFTREKREAEADFVVVDPARGFLVLEVKDGAVAVRNGIWLQNGRRMDPPPLDQAHRAANVIADRLREAIGVVPPFGIGVVLPHVAGSADGAPDDVRRRLIGADGLAHVGDALRALFAASVPVRPLPADDRWIDAIHALWGETWVPRLSLGAEAKRDAEARVRLDGEQIALLESLFENERLHVKGGAGTGKTLLVREAARRFASGGRNVLVLCFTDALATWLRTELPETVTVETTRRFAAALLAGSGAELPAEEARDAAFWSSVAKAAIDAAPEALVEPRWDAVVVDEAQDLDARDWELVRLLSSRKGARLWLFGDPAQGFWRDRRPPDDLGALSFTLKTTYRCHAAIQALADLYADRDADVAALDAGIADGRIRIAAAPNHKTARDRVRHELDALRREGFAADDVAIVSVVGQTARDTLATAKTLGPHTLRRADRPAAEGDVVADTFLRFKGLERAAVIVTDLPGSAPGGGESLAKRMHIAVSRAQSALRIIGARTAMLVDPVLKERI